MIIVVGFTPTPPGQAALQAGIDAARRLGGSLVVLNSSRGDALSDPSFAQESDLAWVRATCEEAGIKASIRQEVRGREAAEELLDVLSEVKADLCVIGLRHRTPIGKMLLGSNAHQILMDAPCPVLSVKASPHE